MWLTGLVAPRHVGSSQTRARTRVPCISRQILNHCATREAPVYLFKQSVLSFIFFLLFFWSLFISILIFVIFFLLLILGLVCSFSSSLKCKVVYLRSVFLIYAFITLNFPLRTALLASHRFWYVVFLFSFILRDFFKLLF